MKSIPHHARSPLALVVVSVVIGLGFSTDMAVGQAAGVDAPQNRGAGRNNGAGAPSLTTGAIEFANEPFRLDAVGLTMRLPLGATAQSTSMGARAAVQISPKDLSWLVNIQTPQTTNPKVTTAETANSIAVQVMKAGGGTYDANDPNNLVAVNGKVVEPCRDVQVNGQTGSRIYIAVPDSKGVNTIRGYTVFKPSATQFVTFELLASEALFPRAKLAYEAMIATADFSDPSALNSERAAAIAAGVKVFEGFDEQAMRAMVKAQPERWERLYHPAASGSPKDAIEVGYRRIRLSLGNRESVSGGARGGEEGIVVRLDARYLPDVRPDLGKQESKRIVDSQSVYFMSFDRAQEVWSVRMAIRSGKEIATSSEVGARDGRSMNVQIDVTGKPTQTIRPLLQGDGYVSRVESLLMPQILIRAGVESSFGFYAYKSDGGGIQLRRDTLEQPSDRPGLYRVTTRFAEEADKTTVSLYNEKGELLSSELPDGTISRPIGFEELLSLWKSKHLTTE